MVAILESGETQTVEESAAFQSLMRFYGAEGRYSASNDPIDRAALLDTLHPEIALYQPESLPYGGVWRGREPLANGSMPLSRPGRA